VHRYEVIEERCIRVWENEGGACDKGNILSADQSVPKSKPIGSREAFYFHNLTKELESGLEDKTLVRPDSLDGSECPETEWIRSPGTKAYKMGKSPKNHN